MLVARPRLADLNSLAAYLEARGTPDHRPPVLVLVGPGPYATAEVSAALGLQVVSHLPWGPAEAELLPLSPPNARHFKRTALVRALRTLADDLARLLTTSAPPSPGKPTNGRGPLEVPV